METQKENIGPPVLTYNSKGAISGDLDELMEKEWSRSKAQRLPNFKDEWMQSKKIPGTFGFFAISCPIRAVKRKANPFTDFDAPFDPSRFNFNKVHPDEILFLLRNVEEKEPVDHKVLINLSPIDKSGGLLVPYLETNHNQRMTERSLKVVFDFMRLSKSQNLAVFFNSLMGFASVNHQHFQIIYLQQQLPILQHKDRKVIAPGISAVENWFTPVIEVETTGLKTLELVQKMMNITNLCYQQRLGFSITVANTAQGFKAYVLPKHPDYEVDLGKTLCIPSAVESLGYLLLFKQEAWENATESDFVEQFRIANPTETNIAGLHNDISNYYQRPI